MKTLKRIIILYKYSYDPNGNILTYNYRANTSKLTYITDAVASGNYPNDIDNESAGNYSYDSIGNLLIDVQAGSQYNLERLRQATNDQLQESVSSH